MRKQIMYGVIVFLLYACAVHALSNDIEVSPGNVNNDLHDSLKKITDTYANNLFDRVLKASTVPYLSRHLEDVREQIGDVKHLVQTGEFSRAEDLLKLIESGNLRIDVAVAETLTLGKPGAKSFELADVVEPLSIAGFALSRAKTKMNISKDRSELAASMPRSDDVLRNLDRLQDGIGNVEKALKSIHGI